LIVDGADSEVLIDRVDYGDDKCGGGGGDGDAIALDGRQRRALSNAQLRMLTSQGELLLFISFDEIFANIYLVAHLRRENADMRLESERQLVIIHGQMTRLNKNIVRFINRPAHPIRHPQHPRNETPAAALAALNITPTAAPILPPMEIEEDNPAVQIHQGIARAVEGTKLGRGVTKRPRTSLHMRGVQTRASIIGEMSFGPKFMCYGRGCSVTNIINKMIADKKEGGHLGLRVTHREAFGACYYCFELPVINFIKI
jgi:hypothetical protein